MATPETRIAAALRPLTPNGLTRTADNVFLLSDDDVLSQWRPSGDVRYDYAGDVCACQKHGIHWCYAVENIKTGAIYDPIGSVCIQKFFDVEPEKTALFESLSRIENYISSQSPSFYLTPSSVCSDNGFSRAALDWLARHLSPQEAGFLRQIASARNEKSFSFRQRKFLAAITNSVWNVIRVHRKEILGRR